MPQWTLGSLKFPWKISHLLIHKQAEPTTLLDNGRRQLVFIVGARGLPHTALSPQLSRRNSASEPSMRTGSCCWRHAHIWYILIVFIQKGLITKNKKIKTEGKEKWCVQSCRIQSHANKLILVASYGIISPALDGRSGGRKITQLIRELGSIGSMTIESPSDAWTARREPRGYGFGLVETLNNPMLSTHSTLSFRWSCWQLRFFHPCLVGCVCYIWGAWGFQMWRIQDDEAWGRGEAHCLPTQAWLFQTQNQQDCFSLPNDAYLLSFFFFFFLSFFFWNIEFCLQPLFSNWRSREKSQVI